MDDKKSEMPFFNGPFNPKYKDLNLYNKEYDIPIKIYNQVVIERKNDRIKQKQLIKKYKILDIYSRHRFILN
jgi:hypothetical protein